MTSTGDGGGAGGGRSEGGGPSGVREGLSDNEFEDLNVPAGEY